MFTFSSILNIIIIVICIVFLRNRKLWVHFFFILFCNLTIYFIWVASIYGTSEDTYYTLLQEGRYQTDIIKMVGKCGIVALIVYSINSFLNGLNGHENNPNL